MYVAAAMTTMTTSISAEHVIELAGVRRGKAAVHDELEPLSDGEHGRRRNDEADRGEDDLRADTGAGNGPRARRSSAR